jgi:dTDP-4-dehydrorhamnose 3,5-epimerase
MEIQYLQDSPLILIQPKVFLDSRGSFSETFSEALFRMKTGVNINFVQDNESVSKKNVFRGFHFQVPPKAQAKLIRVVKGAIRDFVIDLRKSSDHFGKVFFADLSEENKHQLYIPEGFAHGFIALEDHTIVNYKCSQYYSPESERILLFSDPQIKIEWPISKEELTISSKDMSGQPLSEYSDIFI